MPLTFSCENDDACPAGARPKVKDNKETFFGSESDSHLVVNEVHLNASDSFIDQIKNSGFSQSSSTKSSENENLLCETDASDKKINIEKRVYISEDIEEDKTETSALRRISENSDSAVENSVMSDNCLTMSGTIKRGKKKGQNVDVILNMSREELEILEANIAHVKSKHWQCESNVGFHVLIWSVLCMPFSFIISCIYAFCIGTLTWYNIFVLFSEEKPICYRILVSPILILSYPFLIVFLSLSVGVYAAVSQISWIWSSWLKEVTDFEKGFYGWLCNVLDLSECCPYEVVVLSGIQKPDVS